MRLSWLFVATMLACGACSKNEEAHATIGATGGSLTSGDGALQMTIPAGALTADTAISITTVAGPAGTVGTAYDISPDGTQFAVPVALRFQVPPPMAPSAVQIGLIVDGAFQPLHTAAQEDDALTTTTMHLSRYALYGAFTCNGSVVLVDAGAADGAVVDAPVVHVDAALPVEAMGACGAPTQCTHGGCGIPCGTQTDCPRGLVCQTDPGSGARTCLGMACGAGRQCPTGLTCDVINICSAPCSPGNASTCPAGSVCLASGTCAHMACGPGVGCPTGSACFDNVCLSSPAGCRCGAPGCDCSGSGSGGGGGPHLDGGVPDARIVVVDGPAPDAAL